MTCKGDSSVAIVLVCYLRRWHLYTIIYRYLSCDLLSCDLLSSLLIYLFLMSILTYVEVKS